MKRYVCDACGFDIATHNCAKCARPICDGCRESHICRRSKTQDPGILRTPVDEKIPARCPYCYAKPANSLSMLAHIRLYHSGEHRCRICRRRIDRRSRGYCSVCIGREDAKARSRRERKKIERMVREPVASSSAIVSASTTRYERASPSTSSTSKLARQARDASPRASYERESSSDVATIALGARDTSIPVASRAPKRKSELGDVKREDRVETRVDSVSRERDYETTISRVDDVDRRTRVGRAWPREHETPTRTENGRESAQEGE